MNLVHVVPHIDREASGPSYSVPRLCQELAAAGDHVELHCLAAGRSIDGVALAVHRQWRFGGSFAISPEIARALSVAGDRADIVHNHSLWSMANVAAGWVVPGRGAHLVVSPRGTLAPPALARSVWRKRLLWPLQRRTVVRAELLHATSAAEYSDIRAIGIRAPVAIVPNGIDVPASIPPRKVEELPRTLLFLGRIHPIKGLDRLLHAWGRVAGGFPDWRLVIAGPGNATDVGEIRQLVQTLGLERVEFAGPLYGDDKSRAYFDADLFILPSHTENFAMAVAEALAHGCPAIVSHGAPWSELSARGAGWWVDNSVDSLAATLDIAMRTPRDRLGTMGEAARDWMRSAYAWSAVAADLRAAYGWLLDGGDVPQCVRIG